MFEIEYESRRRFPFYLKRAQIYDLTSFEQQPVYNGHDLAIIARFYIYVTSKNVHERVLAADHTAPLPVSSRDRRALSTAEYYSNLHRYYTVVVAGRPNARRTRARKAVVVTARTGSSSSDINTRGGFLVACSRPFVRATYDPLAALVPHRLRVSSLPLYASCLSSRTRDGGRE